MKIEDFYATNDDLAEALELCLNVKQGGYSKVYLISDSLVIKETDDEQYLKFVDVVLDATYHKSFPFIWDLKVINNVHYILMERLFEDDWLYLRADEAEIAGYAEKDSDLWRGLNEEIDKALTTLDNAWDSMTDYERPEWDLRACNIMKRKDGTPVITDPWSEDLCY